MALGTAKKILIVEDNELNLKLFKDLLETRGFRITATRDGFETMKLLDETQPDLILMDVQLQGISGLEIIRQIKEHQDYRTIPIIAVTAFAMKDDKERIMRSGCEDYVAKPISIGPFLDKIGRYMNSEVIERQR